MASVIIQFNPRACRCSQAVRLRWNRAAGRPARDAANQGSQGGKIVALLEWTDEFSVGIKLIDKQHMILIRTINLLAMAVQRNSSKDLLTEIMETLVDYTDTHFAYEEELFDRFGYPDTAEHKAAHRSLLGKVVDFK